MQDEARRMMALFEGYDGAHGTHGNTVKNPNKNDKLEIKTSARTVREPVTVELWERHLSGERPVGIIPVTRDSMCMFGCIDIDRYDIDHGAIVRQLAEAHLPLLLCRSKSGGAHIYMFMAEPVEPVHVQAKLRDIAAQLGYGGSEIFPKQRQILFDSGDLGVWLNMPYCGGDASDRYCVNEQGRGLTLGQFLSRAESSRLSADEMIALRAASKEADSEFKDGPPCLQHLTSTGFPEGTRNNGLFAFGLFLKKKHLDRWELMLEQVNQRFFNPPLPASEVLGLTKSLKSKDYKYSCTDIPLVSHCNAGLCRTRKYGVGMRGTLPTMDSLTIVRTDEPTWFLDVDGERIELNTDELQQPSRFQRRCMETIQVVVPVMKKETWDQILQGLMANLTVIEAPAEVSVRGQLFEHIETFCTDRQQAQTKEELVLGKAWHDEETGRVYFRIRDIQDYLEKVKFRAMTRTQMTNRIREWGGGSHFFNIKGRGVNVFWLPSDRIFSVQETPHDLPTGKEEVI